VMCWSLLWLQQQYIYFNGTVLCVAFIVIKASVFIVQWYCIVCGVYCGYSNSRNSAMVLCCVWRILCLQQQ